MADDRQNLVRNIGFIAHIDAGKTTVTERVLYYTGKIHKMGEVHNGQATMDWMPQEQQRGITISSAVTTCSWRGHDIHIIDTPGHVDFTIEVERCLRVLDGAVIIMCAVGGVEAQTETVCRQARKYGIPMLGFVNKLDRTGADFNTVLEQMRSRLEVSPLPLQMPVFKGEQLTGVADLLTHKVYTWDAEDGSSFTVSDFTPEQESGAAIYIEKICETLADFDERIMEAYLTGERIGSPVLKNAVRKATLENRIVPVLCGSALKNKGIQPLIDAIVDYLPSPPEAPPLPARDRRKDLVVLVGHDKQAPLVAYAFKVQIDEGRRLVYLRIYTGRLEVGQDVYNPGRDAVERVSRLFQMHAHSRQRIDQAEAGDIVAAIGLKVATTGDTLTAERTGIMLESIEVQHPVISLAVEPRNTEAAGRFEQVVSRMMDEDPTLHIEEDRDTGQTILQGMGELHLEVAVERLRHDFGVELNVGKPQVLYRTTVQSRSECDMVFNKSIGETRHYGAVAIEVAASERGGGNRFSILTGLDGEQGDHVMAGLREACLADPVYGHEVVDIEVKVKKVDTSEGATLQGIKIASQMALQKAIGEAGVLLLEPVMELDVMSPEENVGDVVGDLSSCKAAIEGVDVKGRIHTIRALVPLSSTFGYSTKLRSLTSGRGSFDMRFRGYDRI